MGIALERFYLYPPIGAASPALLIRTLRPAAPNAAQPAVDYADDLADAKADLIVRSWMAASGVDEPRAPAPIGECSPLLDADAPEERALLAFHGGELELWWTFDEARPYCIEIGPGDGDEPAFWRWLDESVDDRAGARLRRPATRLRVRLITEADVGLVDEPLLLVEELDWMTSEEFDRCHRRGGLAAMTSAPRPTTPDATEEEHRRVKLALVERALADDLAHEDRRAAAFRCGELARFDPSAALSLVERLSASARAGDDLEGIAWALGYGLHHLRGAPGQLELVARWRAQATTLQRAVLAKLDELDDLDAPDDLNE